MVRGFFKFLYLNIVFLCVEVSGYAQVNLVPNPSFETFTQCPDGFSEINFCGNWIAPTTGTPDYYNSCFDSSMAWTGVVDVPVNGLGNQNGIGNAYVGILAWYPNTTTYREYIQAQLSSSLISNQKYYVSCYVSLADSSRFSTDAFGVLLSSTAISRSDYDAFGFSPQILNASGTFMTDKTNWIKISGSFIASGSEQFITIGNFKKDSLTDTLRVMQNLSPSSDYNGAYYFVDQICVSTDSLTCNMPISIVNFGPEENLLSFNTITKELTTKSTAPYELKIYNLVGETLSSGNYASSINLNLSNYPRGYYLVALSTSKKTVCKKIVINP